MAAVSNAPPIARRRRRKLARPSQCVPWLRDRHGLGSARRSARVERDVEDEHRTLACTRQVPSDRRRVVLRWSAGWSQNVAGAAMQRAVRTQTNQRDRGRVLRLTAKERLTATAAAAPCIDDRLAVEPQRPPVRAGTEPKHARRTRNARPARRVLAGVQRTGLKCAAASAPAAATNSPAIANPAPRRKGRSKPADPRPSNGPSIISPPFAPPSAESTRQGPAQQSETPQRGHACDTSYWPARTQRSPSRRRDSRSHGADQVSGSTPRVGPTGEPDGAKVSARTLSRWPGGATAGRAPCRNGSRHGRLRLMPRPQQRRCTRAFSVPSCGEGRIQPGLFAQLITVPLFHEHRILCQVAGHRLNVAR